MSTPHPEPHTPATPVFGTIDGQPIDACLPFHLVDTDDAGQARSLAATDIEVNPDLLAMILFAASRPGDLDPADDMARWGLIADAVLIAGVIALTRDYHRMREVADRNPDLDGLLWWEDCRERVRRLFSGRPLDARLLTTSQPTAEVTDQPGSDESAEEA
jgi:hypothetical protein